MKPKTFISRGAQDKEGTLANSGLVVVRSLSLGMAGVCQAESASQEIPD